MLVLLLLLLVLLLLLLLWLLLSLSMLPLLSLLLTRSLYTGFPPSIAAFSEQLNTFLFTRLSQYRMDMLKQTDLRVKVRKTLASPGDGLPIHTVSRRRLTADRAPRSR